jgi:hypothetical protein
VARHDPREARFLGLWTAGWLAVLLFGGLLWLGDLSLQWPVLAVPLLWALLALRPRRRGYDQDDADDEDDEDDWEPIPRPAPWNRGDPGIRTDTVERPALRRRDRNDGRD